MLSQRSLAPLSSQELTARIRNVPDFPKPGIVFKDISPLLRDPEAFADLVSRMSHAVKLSGATCIVGLESRGFIFGIAIAQELGLPFVPARKPGKLPGDTEKESYALEYGNAALEIQRDAVTSKDKVAIVDDLLATGGTARAAGALVERLGGTVAGYFFAIELGALNGRDRLGAVTVDSVLKF